MPLEITASDLAQRIRVPERVIANLIAERDRITPDLALRLSRLLRTSAEFWLNGQLAWDLYNAIHAPEAAEIENIIPVNPSNAGEANPVT